MTSVRWKLSRVRFPGAMIDRETLRVTRETFEMIMANDLGGIDEPNELYNDAYERVVKAKVIGKLSRMEDEHLLSILAYHLASVEEKWGRGCLIGEVLKEVMGRDGLVTKVVKEIPFGELGGFVSTVRDMMTKAIECGVVLGHLADLYDCIVKEGLRVKGKGGGELTRETDNG